MNTNSEALNPSARHQGVLHLIERDRVALLNKYTERDEQKLEITCL
jgi:hypothetical protein